MSIYPYYRVIIPNNLKYRQMVKFYYLLLIFKNYLMVFRSWGACCISILTKMLL